MSQRIVFIDTRVVDADSILAGIAPDDTVVWLDTDRDGVAQITAALAGLHDIGSVHIISHGSDGALLLGNTTLTESSLASYTNFWTTWRANLTTTADILLYGCDVASTETGQSFIESLARYTNADVAASTDRTGAAVLGGDWVLEARTGAIETQSVSAETYGYMLGMITGTDGNDTLTGTTADDVLRGQGGNDLLRGLDGSDWLEGNAGNDTLEGGAGNDVFWGGAGDDRIDGGAGSNSIHYDGYGNSVGPVTVDLGAGTARSADGNDTLIGIEDVWLSDYDDTGYGGAGDDVLRGQGGNDLLRGLDGSDWLEGNAGNDRYGQYPRQPTHWQHGCQRAERRRTQ